MQKSTDWFKMLKKNIRNNRQLISSNIYQISFLGKDNLPKIECIQLRFLNEISENELKSYKNSIFNNPALNLSNKSDSLKNLQSSSLVYELVFTVDNREPIFDCLAENPFAECCVYFPLTREKFIISSLALCGSKEILEDSGDEHLKNSFSQIWYDQLSKNERNSFTKRDPNVIIPQKFVKNLEYNW